MHTAGVHVEQGRWEENVVGGARDTGVLVFVLYVALPLVFEVQERGRGGIPLPTRAVDGSVGPWVGRRVCGGRLCSMDSFNAH